ncbi:MAG TPA: hypothetical protein VN704_01585 [Verrucomicrobiae bacterium]|nr:hypothetical protein [Verrucomicrobiae bacterium]
MTNKLNRPLGVTVLAIIIVISGILIISSGISLISLGALLYVHLNSTDVNLPTVNLFQFISVIIGTIISIIGIIYVLVFYGLIKGKGWSWTVTVIVTIINLIIQIVSLFVSIVYAIFFVIDIDYSTLIMGLSPMIIDTIVSIIILYYFYKPHVKSFFGKV